MDSTSPAEATTPAIEAFPAYVAYVFVDYGDPNAAQEFRFFQGAAQVTYPGYGFCTIPLTNPKEELMRARAQVYRSLRMGVRGPIMYLDTDVICFTPLPLDFWQGDWDIALTTTAKTWPIMPFNGGVWFAKDTDNAKAFVELYCKACNDVPDGLTVNGDWWCDQLALNYAYMTLKDTIKIAILPHEQYNFAPEGVQATDAYFVHCKGNRKRYMRQYLATLLGTDHFE